MTNLLRFYTNILESVEIGGQIDAIYTDLKKAFDWVNINLLIIKLRNLGMVDSLCSWFESYLRDRKQQVIINGNISDKFEVHRVVIYPHYYF
jgi:hypothetical protein